MRYTILHVLCEGQTEERFVKDVLAPYLRGFGVYTKAVLLVTSRKKDAKGGMLSYAKAAGDLQLLLKQYRDSDNERHIFTTMFDYYALPDDFPGFAEAGKMADVRRRISCIEEEFGRTIASSRFIPYIQLHEFEALLFSDIEKLAGDYPLAKKQISVLKDETDAYADPEMIDNGRATAPSKRIIKALEKNYNYNKVASGARTASAIGLNVILEKCRHFRGWIDRIISLAAHGDAPVASGGGAVQ